MGRPMAKVMRMCGAFTMVPRTPIAILPHNHLANSRRYGATPSADDDSFYMPDCPLDCRAIRIVLRPRWESGC